MNTTKISAIVLTGLLFFSSVGLAASDTQRLELGVMSKQSLSVTKLAAVKTMFHGMPAEKAVFLIRVRSNDAHKIWHVQSNLLAGGKPVLSGKLGEFTHRVELIQPLGQAKQDAGFYLSTEI